MTAAGRAAHDAPYWCEENVWHLCTDARVQGSVAEVAVVTNADRHVALFHQRASARDDGLVVWDYHVLLFSQHDGAWLAWDLDTTLAFPVSAREYLDRTFPPELDPSWQPMFRVVDRDAYVRDFGSDRSHMRGPDGEWLQPPPPWPAIGHGRSLPRLLDLDDASAGPWLDIDALHRRYS